ncbi:hypothetical protein [Sediminibacterium sp.]|uniref:hypothetical protein n=1 Tax=Sediminibacterium sp. TaxID=1917865 RepID=UPI0027315D30|nr:hypothetical protein [Sediminibacterium sp.]MDP2419668.1 hypothetical protein [Sediminibacterium sp.]
MDILINYHKKLVENLNALTLDFFKETTLFQFNTGEMNTYVDENTSLNCQMWDRFWKVNSDVTGPVIYWFSIADCEISNEQLLNEFDNYRLSKLRTTPPLSTNAKQSDSRVLYVGSCRSTRIRDRFFWHTGYYKESRTQGLQLCHWAIPLNLPILFQYIRLDPALKYLTNVYESELARVLKPLLGKHK